MVDRLLKGLRAYRYIVEADVEVVRGKSHTYRATVRHKFLIGREWKILGYLNGAFGASRYELHWLDYRLPAEVREFVEHRSLEAIKNRISLIWGFERMVSFENSLETSQVSL